MNLMMNDFFIGVHYFINGFSLITQPGMKRFVIVPTIINIIFFIGLFLISQHYLHAFNAWVSGFLPAWLHWLVFLIWILFFISFFLIFIFTFVTFANLLCAPFNSFLSEKIEILLTGKIPEYRSLYDNIKDIPRIVGRQLIILGFYLPRALLIVILFFIPVIQLLAPIIWFLFHAYMITLTYIDYPTDNHRIPMDQVRAHLKAKILKTMGFGASVLVASMIPFLNFFTISAAVAGATQFWIDEGRLKVVDKSRAKK